MATLLLMKPAPISVEGEDEKPANGKEERREVAIDPGHKPEG